MARVSAAQRRRDLIEAAKVLILEEGPQSVTARKITERAGASPWTLPTRSCICASVRRWSGSTTWMMPAFITCAAWTTSETSASVSTPSPNSVPV